MKERPSLCLNPITKTEITEIISKVYTPINESNDLTLSQIKIDVITAIWIFRPHHLKKNIQKKSRFHRMVLCDLKRAKTKVHDIYSFNAFLLLLWYVPSILRFLF